jgi:uncharacterized protein YcgI (DUF1989 family)
VLHVFYDFIFNLSVDFSLFFCFRSSIHNGPMHHVFSGDGVLKTPAVTTASIAAATAALHQVARNQNLKVVDVPGDGNCALHAIVDQLAERNVTGDISSLRLQAVSFLRQHSHRIDDSFLVSSEYRHRDAYLKQQSTGGCWCDEIMLQALATLLKYEIHILHHS